MALYSYDTQASGAIPPFDKGRPTHTHAQPHATTASTATMLAAGITMYGQNCIGPELYRAITI